MQRDLVERAMAGDHEAFSELARLSIGPLYAVARLVLRDDAKAEDATQEALVAAWRDLSALRDPDRFDGWMRQLLVRACYREARRDQQRMRHEARVVPLGLAGDPRTRPRRPGPARPGLRPPQPGAARPGRGAFLSRPAHRGDGRPARPAPRHGQVPSPSSGPPDARRPRRRRPPATDRTGRLA